MSLDVTILKKNRTIERFQVKARFDAVSNNRNLYVLVPTEINNWKIDDDEKIQGAEVFFFEGNPNPVGLTKKNDDSGDFLDRVVIKNAIEQTVEAKERFAFLQSFQFLTNPINWIWIIFGAILLWALVFEGLFIGAV